MPNKHARVALRSKKASISIKPIWFMAFLRPCSKKPRQVGIPMATKRLARALLPKVTPGNWPLSAMGVPKRISQAIWVRPKRATRMAPIRRLATACLSGNSSAKYWAAIKGKKSSPTCLKNIKRRRRKKWTYGH